MNNDLNIFPGATQLNSSLLTVSVIAVLLPAAFKYFVTSSDQVEEKEILSVSHGVSSTVYTSRACVDVFWKVAIILLFSAFHLF